MRLSRWFWAGLLTFVLISGAGCSDGSTSAPGASPSAVAATPGNPVRGASLVTKFGCVACHNMPPNDLPASGQGPDMVGVATRAKSRKPGMSAEAYVRESIEQPAAYLVPGYGPIMPSLRKKMTDQEFEDIVAYLMTLK